VSKKSVLVTMHDRMLQPRFNWITSSSSGLLRGIRWFQTDVSGLPIGSIFKGTESPTTPVSNNLTLRNNAEDGRILFLSVWVTSLYVDV
jgi:hypothetical protein